MVLWLHTSSQTKPNLLQIWTKRREVQQASRGVGGGLRGPYSYFTVHSTSSISWGIRAKSPFGGCIFICVYKDVKKKERKNLGLCQGYTLYYFSLNLSFSPSFFIFPLWSRQSQIPIQLPLECGSN